MSRILITGSSDGLGLSAARLLISQGHSVVLHGRNQLRTDAARKNVPGADGAVTGDFARLDDIVEVAEQANTLGRFDAVIHNAGIGFREAARGTTTDGHSRVLSVNVLAPYLLTALMTLPHRSVFLSSGLHRSGDDSLRDIDWDVRPWNGYQAYNDSKLFVATLAFALARLQPTVLSNALEPGWVATKMGGADAPDDLSLAHVTQAWLAVSDDPGATVSGRYFYHQHEMDPHPATRNTVFQDDLVGRLADMTGISLASAPSTAHS